MTCPRLWFGILSFKLPPSHTQPGPQASFNTLPLCVCFNSLYIIERSNEHKFYEHISKGTGAHGLLKSYD